MGCGAPHTSSTTNTSAWHLAGRVSGGHRSLCNKSVLHSEPGRPHHKDFKHIGLVLHLVLQPATHVLHQQLDDEGALERPEVEQVELEHENKFPGRLLIKCICFCLNCSFYTVDSLHIFEFVCKFVFPNDPEGLTDEDTNCR